MAGNYTAPLYVTSKHRKVTEEDARLWGSYAVADDVFMAATREGKPPARAVRDAVRAVLAHLDDNTVAIPETPLDDLARRIHAAQVAKGFWPSKTENYGEERNFGEAIALITSELSEALDEHRSGRALVWFDEDHTTLRPDAEEDVLGNYPADAFASKPEGVAVELADAVIRTFDYLGFLADDLRDEFGLSIDELFELKSKYNATRPNKHGKKY